MDFTQMLNSTKDWDEELKELYFTTGLEGKETEKN